ncbi:hypothetical protein FB451DRAFT_1403117 [Mycena latifolia]|nr:hypothetical protein FB451DRAFT_1403117 [Mycena latifolia]
MKIAWRPNADAEVDAAAAVLPAAGLLLAAAVQGRRSGDGAEMRAGVEGGVEGEVVTATAYLIPIIATTTISLVRVKGVPIRGFQTARSPADPKEDVCAERSAAAADDDKQRIALTA